MGEGNVVLLVSEKYFLRFYKPIAARLAQAGFRPIWVTADGVDQWDYDYVDPQPALERLAAAPELQTRELSDDLLRLERAVFEQPDLFKRTYPYTTNIVRTADRARRLLEAWHQTTLALIQRFRPRAVLLWNGRYLPYSAVSAACEAVGQLVLTSEIGWIPGTIFIDRGALSSDTTDLAGRSFESTPAADPARADAFLNHYRMTKATMVAQKLLPASEARRHLLGPDGRFLLLYGCQVDWDTNVVIGARRFRSNASAVAFLMECLSHVPGAHIVVKTHPLDSDKKENDLRAIVGSRGTVVSDLHPHTLIEAADCVSVRNSTLGFEALCYAKPLIVLEPAKYRHPGLTLEAESVAEGTASLASVSTGRCRLPEPATLRRFVLHVIDHYLVPARYSYFFEPEKLDILSHFEHNDSHQALSRLLTDAQSPGDVTADDGVAAAIEDLDVRRSRQPSFLHRQLRKVADRLF